MVKICGKQNVPPGTPGYDICIEGANIVVEETSYGMKPNVGVSDNYARQDHTHGTPPEPKINTATSLPERKLIDQTKDRILDSVYSNDSKQWIHVIVQLTYNLASGNQNLGCKAYIVSDNTTKPSETVSGPIGIDSNTVSEVSAYIAPGQKYAVHWTFSHAAVAPTIVRWKEFLF